jgi:hypothetical protein
MTSDEDVFKILALTLHSDVREREGIHKTLSQKQNFDVDPFKVVVNSV